MGSSQHKFDRYLSEYMKREKEENSEYYNTMVDIIHGSLTSYAFNSEKFCKNQDELRNLSVFIYTNFLLYLLGYHYDDFSVPANELYVLMNMREIKLKVFSFTLKEATNVLTYCKNYVETVKGMDVDSICYYLKSEKNMKRNNFEVEISNFREKISSLGIEIVNEDINFDNEKKELIKDMEKKLEEFRYNKFKDSSNSEDLERAKRRRLHDIAAILKIKQYRNKDAFNLKEAIAVFLTADQNLATYNYTKQLLDNQSHRDSGTIPEVIVDKFLTDILWQKDPSSNISVESLIATCSRNSYIPPYVWREIMNIFKSNNKDFETNLTAILTHERFREMAKDAESPNDIYKALSDVNKEIESQKKEIKLRAATPT